MSTIYKEQILKIINEFELHEFVEAGDLYNGRSDIFLDNLKCVLQNGIVTHDKIKCDCILLLLHIFSLMVPQVLENKFLFQVANLLSCCSCSTNSFSMLLSMIRTGIQNATSYKNPSLIFAPYLPITLHPVIFQEVIKSFSTDNPTHLSFPGEKDSFLHLSGISSNFTNGYTANVWLKFTHCGTEMDFVIFQCRDISFGLEVLVYSLNEGKFSLAIRANNEKYGKGEFQCDVELSLSQWHMISVSHLFIHDSSFGKVKVFIDGVFRADGDLVYPHSAESFCSTKSSESVWILGSGFRGLISSFGMYLEPLSSTLINFLFTLGCHKSDITQGVSVPHYAYDNRPFGSIFTKGFTALKACRLEPFFVINATQTFRDTSTFFQTGKTFEEHIQMIPDRRENFSSVVITLMGNCEAKHCETWFEALGGSGGTGVLLYFFWLYCVSFNDIIPALASTDSDIFNNTMLCLKRLLKLVYQVLLCDVDFREQFIQLQGFCIIDLSLLSLSTDIWIFCLDAEMIDLCFSLFEVFGTACNDTDFICCALQGLFFDFKLWAAKGCNILNYYLGLLLNALLTCDQELYSSIGLQKLLDIFRCIEHSSARFPDYDETVILIADFMHRILLVTLDFAVTKNSEIIDSNVFLPLFRCLDETVSCLVAVRLLRLITSFRVRLPVCLVRIFEACRFHDITAVGLFHKRGMSAEVVALTITNLVWFYAEQLRFPASHRTQSPKEQVFRTQISLRPFMSAFSCMSMIADVLLTSFSNELVDLFCPDKIDEIIKTIVWNDLDVWLILPFLPTFLLGCSLKYQNDMLVVIDHKLKSDIYQCELMSFIPEKFSLNLFARIIFATLDTAAVPLLATATSVDILASVISFKFCHCQIDINAILWNVCESFKSECNRKHNIFAIANVCLNLNVQLFFVSLLQKLNFYTNLNDRTFRAKFIILIEFIRLERLCHVSKSNDQAVHLLSLILCIMNNLQSTNLTDIDNSKLSILHSSLEIVMSCLILVDENDFIDRMCREILVYVTIISNENVIIHGGFYLEKIKLILRNLRNSTLLHDASLYMKSAYSSLIFAIVRIFLEKRLDILQGRYVAIHVRSLLDFFVGIDDCQDLDLLFRLLDVSIFRTDILSLNDESGTNSYLLNNSFNSSAIKSRHANEKRNSERCLRWLRQRQKLLDEHVLFERYRMKRAEPFGFPLYTIRRNWMKISRKIESEYFYDRHKCQWKLSVAHEGYFPGRRRIILRPQFDNNYVLTGDYKSFSEVFVHSLESAFITSGSLDREFMKAHTYLDTDIFHISKKSQKVKYHATENPNLNYPSNQTDHIDLDDANYFGTDKLDNNNFEFCDKVFLVTASGIFWGILSFNSKDILFVSHFCSESSNDSASVTLVKQTRARRRRWTLSTLSAVYLRRFRLRDSAMEVFFCKGKHRNFFVDFGNSRESVRQRNDFARALMSAAPSNAFKQVPTMSYHRLVFEHHVQDKWLNGQLSNFDYLMALNTIAGRSYNDLCQYPVMPWILSDYSSIFLDLNDPVVYRDLSKPMGALNANRLKDFLDRFNSFEEQISTGIPPFMYGSHYSTMVGVVLHFLVRLQPFAALHQEMQNGHFDVPDRLFSSIPRSFHHNTNQLSEVKELTPEWFTTPDMFRNINNFNFGITQDGEVIADVEMPPWASTPEEFVRLNKLAMESDIVSSHLNEWIDLIFGYKQRGPDAVEAHNVFYYLTYYGSIDHYMVQDDATRNAIELQIAHFGQIPLQLFKLPHPIRKLNFGHGTIRPFKKCFQTANCGQMKTTTLSEERVMAKFASTYVNKNNVCKPLVLSLSHDRLVCVMDNGVIEIFRYSASEECKNALYSKRRGSVNDLGSVYDEFESSTGIISFDNEYMELSLQQPSIGTRHNNFGSISSDDTIERRTFEYLVHVERVVLHFATVPRIPVARQFISNELEHSRSATKQMSLENAAPLIHFVKSGVLVLSGGHNDGRVFIREIDTKTGNIITSGDFRAHRHRVVSLHSDSIPYAFTDVVVSVDESGIIMVWTVSKVFVSSTGHYVISRRPQRLFHCKPSVEILCDISWQLGIVLVLSRFTVQIFSIERDEKISLFCLDIFGMRGHVPFDGSENLCTGPIEDCLRCDVMNCDDVRFKLVMSDTGHVIINAHFDNLKYTNDERRDCVISYTMSGRQTGQSVIKSRVTFLGCPEKGEVVVVGFENGCIGFYCPENLELFHTFSPHLFCLNIGVNIAASTTVSGRDHCKIFGACEDGVCYATNILQSPIMTVIVGPDGKFPVIIVSTTQSGNIFFTALQDFLIWDKDKSPSTLSQITIAPLQAVRGTIQQAQNWTAETAGIFAQNAKTFADDAIGELKKLKKTNVIKGMVSLFGFGGKPNDMNTDSK